MQDESLKRVRLNFLGTKKGQSAQVFQFGPSSTGKGELVRNQEFAAPRKIHSNAVRINNIIGNSRFMNGSSYSGSEKDAAGIEKLRHQAPHRESRGVREV